MGIIHTLQKKLKKQGRTLDPRLLICIECGSDQVLLNNKTMKCKNCGKKNPFDINSIASSNFKAGDFVKIVEYGKAKDIVFKIRKTKISDDGTKQYLLKSDTSDITLLYHESVNSHLEKI